jgi:NADPH:quinone reductase-like Zn-dependent oxidoreductase
VKAAVHTRYGPPDVVRITTVAQPDPGEGELLIRVRATTVNRTDCHYLAAQPPVMRLLSGLRRPKATILGNEFAGDVAAVGRNVTAFAVGDKVFGYCEGRFGAHAEYLVVRADGPVATMPASMFYDEAAPPPRARTTPSRTSGGQVQRAVTPSSSTARPAASARPPSSCSGSLVPP